MSNVIEIKPNLKPEENNILMYLHCGLCLDEIPEGISPMDWSKSQVGWTKEGLQVWCNRHECNVMHIDFEGYKHPAATGRLK